MTDEALKLQRFKEAVSADIDAQVKQLLDDTQAECDRMMAETRITVSRSSETERERLRNEADIALTRKLSAARLEAQRSVLRKREELACGVFDEVRKKLADFRAGGQYPRWLADALAEAAKRYPGSKPLVRLSPEDMKYAEGLGAEAEADSSIALGGIIIGFEGLGAVIDCTFDSMLENERAEFCNNKELMSGFRE